MEFTVSSGLLHKHLSNASRILSGKPTFHILDYLLMRVEGETLSIMGSDLENTILTALRPESVQSEGALAVPSKLLLDTLKEFPDIPMHFTANMESLQLEVKYGTGTKEGEFSFSCQPADEFPEMPVLEQDEVTSIETTSDVLLSGISKTLFTASVDYLSMPHICGVYIEAKPEHLRFVATDANRISCYTRTDIHCDGEHGVLLKNRPAQLLQAIMSSDGEPLLIEFDSRNLQFTTPMYTLVCRLSEGKYPDYEKVIPTGHPDEMVVDRIMFLTALKQVAPFSHKGKNLVELSMEDAERLTVRARNTDSGSEAHQQLLMQYKGEPRNVYFNTQLLTESLPIIASQEVLLSFSPTAKNSMLRPTIMESEEEDLRMVIVHSNADVY